MTHEQTMALNAYIERNRNKPFRLGTHDCFSFTNGAWVAMHGRPYAPDLIGAHHVLRPKALAGMLRETYGADDLFGALDGRLRRVDGVPPRGALVVMPTNRHFLRYAFGIACGVVASFVGAQGLVGKPIDEMCGAWIDG